MKGWCGAVLLAAAIVGCGGQKPLSRGDAATTDAAHADVDVQDALDRDEPDGHPGCQPGNVPIRPCYPGISQCGVACGTSCVDLDVDPNHCGSCGTACRPQATCNEGVCGIEPTTLVAAAPGCMAMRVLHEGGQITWVDVGHGTIKRIPAGGGPSSTIAAGLKLALVHGYPEAPQSSSRPAMHAVATVVVRNGTVYFVGAADAPGDVGGAAGVSIHSVEAGASPKTLLPAALVPPLPGQASNINAIALSPDGKLLYFNAGPRFYRIPGAGATTAADVELVSLAGCPDQSVPTTVVTDGRRLFYPTTTDEYVETFDFVTGGDASATCPMRVAAHVDLPYDTLVLRGADLYCAKDSNVVVANFSSGQPPWPAPVRYAFPNGRVSGFAIGSMHIYAGLDRASGGGDGAISRLDPSRADTDAPRDLVRGQKQPSSLAVDGTNVYWTTESCDIMRLADSPQ